MTGRKYLLEGSGSVAGQPRGANAYAIPIFHSEIIADMISAFSLSLVGYGSATDLRQIVRIGSSTESDDGSLRTPRARTQIAILGGDGAKARPKDAIDIV